MTGLNSALGLILAWSCLISGAPAYAEDRDPCERLLSLAPSLTETIFALGLGSRVVGINSYTAYPPEALSLPKVGGLVDPNYEAIMALKPSRVLVLEEFGEKTERLASLGLKTIVMNHKSVEGILDSINELGTLCNVRDRAQMLAKPIRDELTHAKEKVRTLKRPRTMVVIGGSEEASQLKNIFVSGADGFYNEIINVAGGQSVPWKNTGTFQSISKEAIISFDPEVIVEIVFDHTRHMQGEHDHEILEAWKSLPHLSAVKGGRIYILHDYVYSIPGPRIALVLQKFVSLLHPELAQ